MRERTNRKRYVHDVHIWYFFTFIIIFIIMMKKSIASATLRYLWLNFEAASTYLLWVTASASWNQMITLEAVHFIKTSDFKEQCSNSTLRWRKGIQKKRKHDLLRGKNQPHKSESTIRFCHCAAERPIYKHQAKQTKSSADNSFFLVISFCAFERKKMHSLGKNRKLYVFRKMLWEKIEKRTLSQPETPFQARRCSFI